MTQNELKDLIDQNIKTNSGRISPNKTTGTMLKIVLNEIVNSLGTTSGGGNDKRYHTKVYGEIKMYWGNYYALPKGWVICDGFNGTPDMRGKVPVGWSNGWSTSPGASDLSDYQHIGRVGGTKETTIEKENLPDYNLSNSLSTAAQNVTGKWVGDDGNGHPDGSGDRTTAGGENSYIRDSSTLSIPSLTVEGSVSLGGSNVPQENRQPYMVMMYIMYTGETIESSEKVGWAEYDATTGVKIKEGDSNHRYGFRYAGPASFSNLDPSNYDLADQSAEIISNLGFIPEDDKARPLEKWLQLVSLGDNIGEDDQTTT